MIAVDESDQPIAATSVERSLRETQYNERMLQRAIKQRWPIPEKYKQAVIDRQVKIAVSPESNAREATAAARVLVAAEAQNQADERAEPEGGQHVHFHQHGNEVKDGVGLHSAERLQRIRAKLAERRGASGVGAPSGD